MRELTGAIPGGVTGAILAPLLQGDTHRPRVTVYAAGGRTELSTASLANWSAKAAGLLVDELAAQPEDPSVGIEGHLHIPEFANPFNDKTHDDIAIIMSVQRRMQVLRSPQQAAREQFFGHERCSS